MIHVLVRNDGPELYVLRVEPFHGVYALVDGAKYVHIGRIERISVVHEDGLSVKEWIAVSDGDLYQVRGRTKKIAVERLLERYGMASINLIDTIPALF